MRVMEKILSCVLIFLGFGALFLGFLKIRGGIYGPFLSLPTSSELQEKGPSLDQALALQNKDTDEDGLSDFEETYVYKTSIYLSDTDSDDMDDKEEIEKGYDPLCPKGSDCAQMSANKAKNDTQISTNKTNEDTNNTNGASPVAEQRMTPDIENLTTDEIRDLLIQAGMDASLLDQIDDETLRKVYEETIKEINYE